MNKDILLKMAAHVLLVGLEETPLVGAAIKIGRGCWRILQDGQEQFQQDERIVQLEQAAAHSPDEARQIAESVINEAQQSGQNIDPGRAEAVKDLIAIMPAQIRERTRATINHARRHGTAMATVLPVTTHFAEAEREAFYTNLFPQRRSQFRAGDSIPHHNPEWHLERMLGAGGFGEVWLARHQFLTDQPPWAVKFCQDENSAVVLKREANNLYALRQKLPVNNKHIVMLLELQLTTMPYWLAFEYIDGGTLESQMRLGPMDWPTAWSVFQPILVGMSIVHSLGIVHRDLKPANILLDSHQRPRIADFGIGKILAERDAAAVPRSQNSFTTAGCGTISYMSQEQANGEPAHPSDDVYALGIILWQMLAGKLTSLGYIDDIKILNAPKEIKKAIAACVFYPRARRPADAKLLLNHIITSQVTQPQQQVQPSSPVPVEEAKPHTKQVSAQKQIQVETKPKTKPVGQVKSRSKIKVVTVLKVVALLVVGIAVIRFVMRPSSLPSVPQETHQDKIDADILKIIQAGDGYYSQKNYIEAAKWYRKAAEQGDANGQFKLGRMYFRGEGVTQDYSEAVQWIRKAAEQGFANGQVALGMMYDNGIGVTQDYSEAVKWYFKAAEQGHADGQYNLGFMYAEGYGVTQDDSEAVKWFRKAAEQGNEKAKKSLDVIYISGYGVTKGDKDSEQGQVINQYNLGEKRKNSEGATQDYSEAVISSEWYRKAAEQGDASEQFSLGLMFDKGYGVTQDYSEAVKWYRKAAEQGHEEAKKNLDVIYSSGYGVTKGDKDSKQGQVINQYNLGEKRKNSEGATRDYVLEEAFRERFLKAQQGDANNQFFIAGMYERGDGVTQDYSEAVKWYRKAAEQGHEMAKYDLNKLLNR